MRPRPHADRYASPNIYKTNCELQKIYFKRYYFFVSKGRYFSFFVRNMFGLSSIFGIWRKHIR